MENVEKRNFVDKARLYSVRLSHQTLSLGVGSVSPLPAFRIYTALMAELDRAINTRDVELWNSLFLFPYDVHLDDVDHKATDPIDNTLFFQSLCSMMDADRIDRIERVTDYAEYMGDDLIRGYHMGYMIQDGKNVLDPVTSRMILRFVDNTWKVTSVTNSVSNTQWPYDRPMISDGVVTEMHIRDRSIA